MSILPAILVLSAVSGFATPITLETPDFPGVVTTARDTGPSFELIESRPNGVTDYATWFLGKDGWQSATFHGGGSNQVIASAEPPPGIEPVLRTPGETMFHLSKVIRSGDHLIALYGDPPNRYGVFLNDRLMVIRDLATRGIPVVLDLITFAAGPDGASGEAGVTFQAIRWAELIGGVLYVSNAHRTYSSSSNGLNGYLAAIELRSLRVIWRSGPLVANAENFIVTENHVISGYGFTDEDDFLYALNRWTGEVASRVRLPSAPSYLYLEDDLLHVRCYDTDILFRLRGV